MFFLSGFWPWKKCWPNILRVIVTGRDKRKHIAESQTGWGKKKKGGDELGWNRSKFPSYFPPIFLLNTVKFTFFPHKSAWTVCFRKNIFHWQSHGLLHSVITGMEGKWYALGETIPWERGAGWLELMSLLWTKALHPQHTWKTNSLWSLSWK